VRYASLGSGSKGNGTLVHYRDTCILIDCGFTLKATEQRLRGKGIAPDQIQAILVTHEHSDHIRVGVILSRRYDIPVYLTHGTHLAERARKLPKIELINSRQVFDIGDLQIQPVPVPHDDNEPCQFIIGNGSKKLGVVTDLGSITPFIQKHYSGLDALLLECNHDIGMLRDGPYPHSLKQRVGGKFGHLSNCQAASLLESITLDNIQQLVVSHISQQNNSVDKVLSQIENVTQVKHLVVADQDSGFDWLTIN